MKWKYAIMSSSRFLQYILLLCGKVDSKWKKMVIMVIMKNCEYFTQKWLTKHSWHSDGNFYTNVAFCLRDASQVLDGKVKSPTSFWGNMMIWITILYEWTRFSKYLQVHWQLSNSTKSEFQINTHTQSNYDDDIRSSILTLSTNNFVININIIINYYHLCPLNSKLPGLPREKQPSLLFIYKLCKEWPIYVCLYNVFTSVNLLAIA